MFTTLIKHIKKKTNLIKKSIQNGTWSFKKHLRSNEK